MKEFDFVVIGGGPAGNHAAAAAVQAGARVAVAEGTHFGGECANTACVPSKILIPMANLWWRMRNSAAYGLPAVDVPAVDLGQIMKSVRDLRDSGRPNTLQAPRGLQERGVEFFLERVRFTDEHTLETESGTRVHGARFVIATGTKPAVPPIPGLDQVPFLTNRNVWDLTELPRHLVVIGGGPIGLELGQAFHSLGADVTIVEMKERILQKDEPEISKRLRDLLTSRGIAFCMGATVRSAEHRADGDVALRVQVNGEQHELLASHVLIAAGRAPEVADLDLDAAGIERTPGGWIATDGYLKTNHDHIWAAGDVNGHCLFTHAAQRQGLVAAHNALNPDEAVEMDYSALGWCIYTSPESAHAGLTEKQAQDQGLEVRTVVVEMDEVSKPKLARDEIGLIKLVVDVKREAVIGCSVITHNAGEVIHEAALAISEGLPLEAIGDYVHYYPTYSEILEDAAQELEGYGSE